VAPQGAVAQNVRAKEIGPIRVLMMSREIALMENSIQLQG
jgi:hypothetical protein